MAVLKPDHTYVINGVTVNEKIIPDGTRWRNKAKAEKAGFSAGSLYKKEQKLNKGTGKPLFITIHNTDDLCNVEDDGEQYTRATYNENMNSVRVHFYVDDLCAWQNLKAGTGMCQSDPLGSAEVSWHAADGSTPDGGNMTSISIEIIMNDSAEHDKKAYDNGARLAAWLLYRHSLSINALVTHTYWVNKSAGKKFNDVDEQCTNIINGEKWCPKYIFNSTNHERALENWKKFKACVKTYLDNIYDAEIGGLDGFKNNVARTLYVVQVGSFVEKQDAENFLHSLNEDGFDGYTVTSEKNYTVQVGAYSMLSNAERAMTRLKDHGYDEISVHIEKV